MLSSTVAQVSGPSPVPPPAGPRLEDPKGASPVVRRSPPGAVGGHRGLSLKRFWFRSFKVLSIRPNRGGHPASGACLVPLPLEHLACHGP